MLDLVQVRSFLKVVELGSFHAAARELKISQPAVSQHVRKLEENLSVPLILRGRSQCLPTPRGSNLLPYAQRLLEIASQASLIVGQRRLTIGAATNIGTYLLPGLLQIFRRVHENSFEIELRIGTNLAIRERLQTGVIDIALLEWWTELDGCVASRWVDDRLVAIVPASHPFAGRQSLSLHDLSTEAMIGGEPGTGTGTLLRSALGGAVELKARYELGSTEAVKRAVEAGLGVSIVSRSTVEGDAGRSLAIVELEDPGLTKCLWTATLADQPKAAPAEIFQSFLLEYGHTIRARHGNVAQVN